MNTFRTKRLFTFLFLLATAVIAGCNQDVPGQGISGVVLLGPNCPVVQEEQPCPDTPFQTTLVVTTADGSRVIKEFSSDANGKFEVLLPPGEYTIGSPQGVTLPYCASDPVRVNAGAMTEITVNCDTGIR